MTFWQFCAMNPAVVVISVCVIAWTIVTVVELITYRNGDDNE